MRISLGAGRNGLIASLDIGTTKICCFVARLDPSGRPRVVGIGQQASRGVKSGAIIDMEATEAAVRSAVQAAEEMAGDTVDRVLASLSGGYPASSSADVEVDVAGHEIGETDLRRAVQHCHGREGLNGYGEAGRSLIHSLPVAYSVDGNRGIRDPRGMYGNRLGVNVHFVTAASGPVRNLTTCIERCHLDVAGIVVSPYASGLASLVEDELNLGVTLIDMGGGTTKIAVFFEGHVIYTSVIPVGGQHVTHDIARGLSTPVSQAERMKTLYGHAMVITADDRAVIEVPQVGEEEEAAAQQVPRSLLTGVIQPRLEETFELVRSRLETSGFDKLAGRRVVLTGGACQLPGTRDLAALILDKQVRIGRPIRVLGLAEATAGPAYATCAGLLTYAVSAQRAAPETVRPETVVPDGLIGRLGQWLRVHF